MKEKGFIMAQHSSPVRVRFAPSPTGKLHIGGARTAIFNWAFARATGGSFVLRIEDTDPTRSTDENIRIIVDAMRWLQLDWDEGPEVGGAYGPYRQTERMDTYQKALQQLIDCGAVYRCFCSKEQLDEEREKMQAEQGGYSGYNRACRHLSAQEVQAHLDAGDPFVWRLKVPDNHPAIEFDDAVYGHMSFPADVMDDMILVRSDGTPTYNFAVVCDDINMQITHVIRGDDHLSNTPRQILIYEALGKTPPVFAHLSMILGSDGKKLSKRHGATSVEEYRDKGYLPDAMVNFLALLGWSLDGETTIISRDVLCKAFDLARITKKDAIFDEVKLDWMNGAYIRELSTQQWAQRARPWIEKAGAAPEFFALDAWAEKTFALIGQRLVRFEEIPDKLAFMFWGSTLKELDDASFKKVLAKADSRAKDVLVACEAILADTSIPWECNPMQDAVKQLCDTMQLKPKAVFQPLRVAIAGNMVSPPLFESMELMKREDCVARVHYVASLL